MKGINLGEFEELVLLSVGALSDDAYGVAIQEFIKENTNRGVSIGALHASLSRLVDKGFLEAQFGEATRIRGGRRKKYYTLTISGREALKAINDLRSNLYQMLPNVQFVTI